MEATDAKTNGQRRNGPARGDKGRFLPGASGNPAGRPPSGANRAAALIEEALAGQAEALAAKVVHMALSGDMLAMRLCLERMLAVRRERHMTLQLPAPTAAADIMGGFARVVEAISQGQLTPTETDSLSGLLESARRAIESTDIERRVEELEARLEEADGRDRRPET